MTLERAASYIKSMNAIMY